MKKQFLLPMVAIMLAVGGAYASNQFTPIYYQGGDETCSIEVPDPQCPPGEVKPCIDGSNGFSYHYKPNENSTQCLELLRD